MNKSERQKLNERRNLVDKLSIDYGYNISELNDYELEDLKEELEMCKSYEDLDYDY